MLDKYLDLTLGNSSVKVYWRNLLINFMAPLLQQGQGCKSHYLLISGK